MTSVCVHGVGAIGGLLAAKLALGGAKVTGICRGAQLEAIRARGLTLIERGERVTAQVRAAASPEEAGQQDIVFLAAKSHDLPGIAPSLRPLLGPETLVVTVGNGFPWWYFFRAGGSNVNPTLSSVDSRGALWRLIGPEHAIGCVVYPAGRVVSPGVVEHVYGSRFSVGEPDGQVTERVKRLAALLTSAGFEAPVRQDIRTELWTKLALNVALNPVSLLAQATIGQMLDDAAIVGTLELIMNETAAVAAAFGVRIPIQPRQLLDLTRPLALHKTSMLQDFEAGRRIEIDPIAGAVAELGRLRNLRTPVLDATCAMARLRARVAGCYG
ncbi:MAG: 2-dehydropantoate 2-reductase [Gammaproteobacteria bacterium]|nr:2-dehydropantoate 2-reductase [Gammaproteobacteria bacterium]